MAKPTDQEMTAIVHAICYIRRPQEEGAHHSMGEGQHGDISGSLRRKETSVGGGDK